jgi:PrtD family type I secretion system ABC transporter
MTSPSLRSNGYASPRRDRSGDITAEHVLPRDATRVVRRVLVAAAALSGGLNILLLAPAIYMYQVYDRVLATQHVETLIALTLIALLALVLLGALDGVRGAVGARLGAWLERALSGPLLEATVNGAHLTGTLRGAQPLRDLAIVRGAVGGALWPLLDAPWTPIFFAIAFMIHPLLGWVGILGGLLLLALAAINELLTRRAVQRAGALAIAAIGEADAAVRNADALVAMGMLPSWLCAWQEKREAASAPQRAAATRAVVIGAAAKSVRLALQVFLLGFGAWLVIRHEITSGAMIATSIIVARALAPFEQMIASWRGLVAAQAAWRRLAALLEAAPAGDKLIRLPRPRGDLLVERLAYHPPGAREPILRQVSFAANGGEMVAVIGPSGSGKTTLARLIVGSLAPNAGAARLDGAPIGLWPALDRSEYIGYLPQDVELFNGTVRDNIARFKQPEQGANDDAVVAAASLAGAHETILGLSRGYDTAIGPAGLMLSGGQRQRIGLARAVFGDPRLVVLDEPNASLDADGDAALQTALKRLKERGVTVICVAQRTELIVLADRVLVLRQGLADSFGSRDEVLGRAVRAVAAAGEARRQHLSVAPTVAGVPAAAP